MDKEAAERNPAADSDADSSSSQENRETNEEDSSYRLPPEMWYTSFMHLSKKDKASVALVCRGWRDLVNDHTLWRGERAVLNCWVTEGLQSLAIRRITHISVRCDVTVAQLRELLRTVLSLQCLDLHMCSCPQLPAAFTMDLPHLKKLRLPRTYDDGIFARSRNLEVLRLPGKTATSLTSIVQHLPRLWHLAVRGGARLQERSIDMSVLSQTQFPSLTHLCLVGIDQVDDEQIGYMTAGLPNLQKLCLSLRSVTEAGVQQLARVSSLKELCCTRGVSETKVTELCSGRLQLRTLSLKAYAMTSQDAAILATMTSLEELHSGVEGNAFQGLVGILSMKPITLALNFAGRATENIIFCLTVMSSLQSLHIQWAAIDHCMFALRYMMNLQSLHVTNSTLNLRSLARTPQLQELSLSSCSLKNFNVEDLKRAYPNLRHLNVYDCGLRESEILELQKTLLVTETPEIWSRCLCQGWP